MRDATKNGEWAARRKRTSRPSHGAVRAIEALFQFMSSQTRDTEIPLISESDKTARALSELRRGSPILLFQEDGAALALSAEMVSPERLDAIRRLVGAPGRLAVTAARATTLKARAYDGDLAQIALREDQGAVAVRAIADPAMDLEQPLLGPHLSLRDAESGSARAAIALCKLALLLPAAALWPLPDAAAARALAETHGLVTLTPTITSKDTLWRSMVNAPLPITVSETARLHVFRRGVWEDEHYALEIGEPDRAEPVLTRLHSACATGDLFGSLKCDCGPQLRGALDRIGEAGAGVLVYLQQEGRGIGLSNKLRAYRLQEQGFDTVEANHRLGFEDDERLLRDGGDILRALGFAQARLMTNNPNKLAALTEAGVEVVERVPLITEPTRQNARYLKVKAAKSGHLL